MMKRGQHMNGRHRSAYALLVTLVMLALLGVIIGQLARRSADQALQARAAEDSLRQRWAKLTCQRTLLADAPRRFDARETNWLASMGKEGESGGAVTPRPAWFEVLELELTGVRVWLRIEDEQTKINLNERLRADPDAALSPERVVSEWLLPARAADPRLTRPQFVSALGLQPLETWAQVVPGRSPPQLLEIQHPEELLITALGETVTQRLTLWGSGSLNFHRVHDQALRNRLSDAVAPATIDALLVIRREEPGLDLRSLIDNATSDRQEDRAALQEALTSRSNCYSMWLASRPVNQRDAVARWSLSVIEGAGNPEVPGGPSQAGDNTGGNFGGIGTIVMIRW